MKNKVIYLYSDKIGKVELVDYLGSDLTVVNSARVSLGVHRNKLEKTDVKLIEYLIENKHTSPLEHCICTFRFKVPLFVRSQHHRHRTWSFNEISRRYTSFNIEFYELENFRLQDRIDKQASDPMLVLQAESNVKFKNLVHQHHQLSLDLYNQMLYWGIAREQARGILPQNMYTEYYGTVNLNNLFKFLDLRLDHHAQWEIQKVAQAILEIIKEIYPKTVKAYYKNKDFFTKKG